MDQLYVNTCLECSELITKRYSTSFSMGIRLFQKELRKPIAAIYGFVRFADEIVDTFHDHDKRSLLDKFKKDTFEAIESQISLNPVLQSFQQVVNQYNVDYSLITAFLDSMYMDLEKIDYNQETLDKYIYGSAEVVGLMCLRVFTNGDLDTYNSLKDSAKSLGSAFQKINFLRDMKSDFDDRGRVYFPNVDFKQFTLDQKREIEKDIKKDFDHAHSGIIKLPKSSRLGVYLAYRYYLKLYHKITSAPVSQVKEERIRVPNRGKMVLLAKSTLRHRLDIM